MRYLPKRHGQSSLEPNGWHLSSVLPSPALGCSLRSRSSCMFWEFAISDFSTASKSSISAKTPTRKFPHCTRKCHHALSWKTTCGFQHQTTWTAAHLIMCHPWEFQPAYSASRETHYKFANSCWPKRSLCPFNNATEALSALRKDGIAWNTPTWVHSLIQIYAVFFGPKKACAEHHRRVCVPLKLVESLPSARNQKRNPPNWKQQWTTEYLQGFSFHVHVAPFWN